MFCISSFLYMQRMAKNAIVVFGFKLIFVFSDYFVVLTERLVNDI